MKQIFILFFLSVLLFSAMNSYAQEVLPIIKSDSIYVDIKDNSILKKRSWRISPQIKPDIYVTSGLNGVVTFYTNCDSISHVVRANSKFRFIILLKGKDSALTEILYLPTYKETLKRAAKYNYNDNRSFPAFTYQSSSDSNLSALRKHFNLDSIAGFGSDISKVFNIMNWLHNKVPHDGQHNNPSVLNAESLISVCKKDSRGLNCRGLAIVLNECYLSMGYKSRFVTCIPKDSLKIDSDCHVINAVFINSLNKWVWMDPTNNAYVMDENNVPLSIQEVRERIIADKPLKLNSEANWNNKNRVTKEDYLDNYMAKNLYIFYCTVNSEFDVETPMRLKKSNKNRFATYTKLLPLDYYNQEKDSSGFYLTNNPDLFWQKP